MVEPNESLVDTIMGLASELVRRGSRPEDVVKALLGSAHTLAEREDAEDHLRDLLEDCAERLERV